MKSRAEADGRKIRPQGWRESWELVENIRT